MSRGRTKMKVLLTHSKCLTPPQQAWPPRTQEAFAQLEVKRASRKVLKTIRAICWADHANLTRAQKSDIGGGVKLLRQLNWATDAAGVTSSLSNGPWTSKKSLGNYGALTWTSTCRTRSEGPVPWAVGDQAQMGGRTFPTFMGSSRRSGRAVDYENNAGKALQLVCEEFKMPEWTLTVRPCYGDFEDDDGVWAQFDGATGRLQVDRKVKRARVDLLTSAAKLARAIAE